MSTSVSSADNFFSSLVCCSVQWIFLLSLMMMETLSKTDYALTLTGFFTLLSLLEHGYTYSLPHDEGKKLNKERAEIFYDNKIIPERVEKNVYIYKTITNRFAFIKKNDNSPLAITVTPCASHITWKVTFREIHSQLDSATGNTPSAPLIHLQNFTTRDVNDVHQQFQKEEFCQLNSPIGLSW
ncbi:unnamed protein product [Acanthosepion pharaonis]|uniref:Neuron-derived neurotrophic factor N-terminal domain-containing protein n=1 Tax=Acanthosepion pharaonis TaxID=158019 RepID=A0A812AU77_ACAPH|nr:unnamed protein product [Sepia pharaonis]